MNCKDCGKPRHANSKNGLCSKCNTLYRRQSQQMIAELPWYIRTKESDDADENNGLEPIESPMRIVTRSKKTSYE